MGGALFLYSQFVAGSHAVKNASWNVGQTVPDYFNGVVLQRHNVEMPGSSFGHLKFQVAFNLAVVWMIVFVSLSKGKFICIYPMSVLPQRCNCVSCQDWHHAVFVFGVSLPTTPVGSHLSRLY